MARAIAIGHPAYPAGINAFTVVHSAAAAVRELRARGAKRDDARQATRAALAGSHAVVTGGPLGMSAIEVRAAHWPD